MIYGWDHPCTAERYERFCERHERYRTANAELVKRARVEPGMRVLDLAAGTGRTGEACLALGAEVVCWEPAAAMRAIGERRVPAAIWVEQLPAARFDRVLCGAAAWQWQPFASFVSTAVERLDLGAALAFNMPSLYLGIPDEPGEGEDPLLFELPSRLACGAAPRAEVTTEPLSIEAVEEALERAGIRHERWRFDVAMTLDCQCDWYRIPVLTDALLTDFDLAGRDARVDEARAGTDPASWKREGWIGWTAWKP
jgi:hypothetical protein